MADRRGKYGATRQALALLCALLFPTVGSACGDIPLAAGNLLNPAIMVHIDHSARMAELLPTGSGEESRQGMIEEVLGEVFLDRGADWGLASWSGGDCSPEDDPPADNWTTFHLGVQPGDDDHQRLISATAGLDPPGGCAPLAPALAAAGEYFAGQRPDSHYQQSYEDYPCRSKVVLLIAGGDGDTATTSAAVEANTRQLLEAGISLAVVGVAGALAEAGQLATIAALAQDAGEANTDDQLYPLQRTDPEGRGEPYLIDNAEELRQALTEILTRVKGQALLAAPSAGTTTSAANEQLLLTASYASENWTGDFVATALSSALSAVQAPLWSAAAAMPSTANAYFADRTAPTGVSTSGAFSFEPGCFLDKALGDILGSTPKIVGTPQSWHRFDGYGDFKYRPEVQGRPTLAYVTANDGALHAFDLADGEEAWRFYPEAVQTRIADLGLHRSASGNGCHYPLLDGSPEAADISTGSDWQTVLITGLGQGGPAYFGLEVTTGNGFGSPLSAAPAHRPSRSLWEFSDADLGFATSSPEIARVARVGLSGVQEGSRWAAFFSSGEQEEARRRIGQEAYLFAVDAWDGSALWLNSAGEASYKVKLAANAVERPGDIAGDPAVVDLDDDQLDDLLYLGNAYGNLFRVAGIGQGQWPVVDTFFFSGREDRLAPIASKPEIAFAGDQNVNGIQDLWVAFGSGRYQVQSDRWSREQQYLYGLLDREGRSANPHNPESAAYQAGDLVELTSNLVSGHIVDRDGMPKDLSGDGVVDAEDLRVFRTISCSAPGEDGRCNPVGLAWRLALAAGSGPSERVLVKPLAVAGILFAATFIPDADPCRGGGETWLFALELDSGRAVPLALFDINRDGGIDQTDNMFIDQQGQGQLAGGYLVGRGRPTGLSLHGDSLIIGLARGSGEAQDEQAVLQEVNEVKIPGMRAKFQAWRQLFVE